jgi:hypothetical protein
MDRGDMINYSKRSLILSILSNTDELIFLLECFENYLKLIFLKVFFFLQCKILDNIYTYNLRIIPYSMYPDDCVVLIMIIYLIFFSLPDFLFIFMKLRLLIITTRCFFKNQIIKPACFQFCNWNDIIIVVVIVIYFKKLYKYK